MRTSKWTINSKFVMILGVFIFALSVPYTSVQAAYDYNFETRPRNLGAYELAVEDKATRGLTNVALGWTELFSTPVNWSADPHHGPISGVLVGIPYGMLRTVGRTLTGVYEIFTVFAPQDPIFYPLEGDKS